MSEERRDQAMEDKSDERAASAIEEEDDDDIDSPFDHPAFLPVILWGLAIWFGYDGWFNENIEAVMFNRVVFVMLVVGGIYYTIQAVREIRETESGPESESE